MIRRVNILPLHILRCIAEFRTCALIILSISLFTACASDDDPVVIETENTISFGGSIFDEEENSTRAASGKDAADLLGSKFIVYGYKTVGTDRQTVFPGYTVEYTANSANTTTTNTCGWEYDGLQPEGKIKQSIKYWDTSADEYRIFGITSTASNEPTTTTTGTETDVTFNIDATTDANIAATPYFSDLWYKSKADLCVTDPIQLTFRKPLCKVRIMFVDENGVQYSNTNGLAKQEFKPVNSSDKLILKGTFTLKYPISEGSATSYTYTSKAESSAADEQATISALTVPYETGTYVFASESDKEKWYTLLPPESQGDFKLTAEVGGNAKEVIIPASLVQWKPGYSYTYIFKVSDAASDVTLINVIKVAVKTWLPGGTTSKDVYNW